MTDFQIVKVIGSNSSANNVLHPTPDTKFSSKGLGSYLDISLSKKQSIGGLSIAFFAGDKRKVKFTVASLDGDPKLVQTFASSGHSAAAEDFYFDKPVNAQTLRISFAGSFQTGVTFDQKALETVSSDTDTFKCGVAVTGALQASKGLDDGTVNDWFSVTQISVLPAKIVQDATKSQEADQKKHEQYEKQVEKENQSTNKGCGCSCDIHSSTKDVKKAQKENREFQKAGTQGGIAGINKDNEVVSKADANQAKINQSPQSNQAAVNQQGINNPTSQNSTLSKPAAESLKPNFGLASAQQNSETKNQKKENK